MPDFGETMQFSYDKGHEDTVEDILSTVYAALKERGYDPNSQLVGYLISGDPTYITTHNGARSLIRRLERDEILEEVVGLYLRHLDGKA